MKSALKTSSQPAGQAAGAAGGAPPSQGPTSTTTAGGSLLDGKFDEGESHNSFLDALKAWRGEPTAAAEETTKSVRFKGENSGDQAAAPGGAKKGFLAGLGNSEFETNCLPEPPTFADGGI